MAGDEAGDRMLAMIQQELDRDDKYITRGQYFAVLTFVILVGGAVYMGIIGNKTGVISFTSATCIGIVANFQKLRR